MRDLARKVALAYLEQRRELEYPLLKKEQGSQKPVKKTQPSVGSDLVEPFLLEIGVEELRPVTWIQPLNN